MKNKITTTIKTLNGPWGKMVGFINDNPETIYYANELAIAAFEDGYRQPELAKLLVILLEHNNILFHRNADFTIYQKLANCLSDLLENQSINIEPIIRARGYSNSVYASYIYKDGKTAKIFEQKLLGSLALFENDPTLLNDRFLAYINISQFYLFQGQHEKTISYLEKAKEILVQNQITILNYHALFWYHYTWIYVEKGEYSKAKEHIEDFFSKISPNSVSPGIYLHALNIRDSIEFYLKTIKTPLSMSKNVKI